MEIVWAIVVMLALLGLIYGLAGLIVPRLLDFKSRREALAGAIGAAILLAFSAWMLTPSELTVESASASNRHQAGAVSAGGAPSESRVQTIRDMKSVTDIAGVRFANDQVIECARAAVLDIKASSSSTVFEEGFRSAQEAMIWVSERAADWGSWRAAHKSERKQEDWAKVWRGVAPCFQWIKVNFSYTSEDGRTDGFSVIWPRLGSEADKLQRLTPSEVVDASLFDGSSETAKIDIERWCRGGGSRIAPRFCMATFVNLCQGHLYPRYERQCDGVMAQRKPT